MNTTIRLHPEDHVLVTLMDMQMGEIIQLETMDTEAQRSICLFSDVPKGHKISLSFIKQGEIV